MNKKFLLPIFLVLGIGMVLAISYYAIFSVSVSHINPIIVTGETDLEIDCGTEDCLGNEINIENIGAKEREITISDDNENEDLNVSYLSELTLSQKIVDFGSNVWEIDPDGDTAVIRYTLVGNSFNAEVIEGAKEGYVLIYYKDNSDRFNNPAKAILIEDIEGNLPYETDGNVDEYDYCETGEYVTCHGGKIWYIPENAVDVEGNINWGLASDFLYETELIQYSEGHIIYPEQILSVYPYFEFGPYANGTYNIEIQIV